MTGLALAAALGAAFAIGLGAGLALSARQRARVRQVAVGVSELAGGNSAHRVLMPGSDSASRIAEGVNVINLKVNSGQSPLLTINERYLGNQFNTGTNFVWGVLDIAQNQPLEFSWAANATGYAGLVTGYRYGWDVADVTNDDDPGWSVQRGLSAAHLRPSPNERSTRIHCMWSTAPWRTMSRMWNTSQDQKSPPLSAEVTSPSLSRSRMRPLMNE